MHRFGLLACGLLLAFAPVHAQTIPQPGLIANVPFTEQTGSVANDITGNGNACTFSAAPNARAWNGIGLAFGVNDNQSCAFPAALSATARTVAVCAYIPAGVEMSTLNGAGHGNDGGLAYPNLLGATNRSGLTLWLVTPPYGTERLYYQQSMYSGYGGFPTGTNDMSIGWNCFFYEFGSKTDSPATVDHLFKNGVETTSYTAQGASAALAAASGAWMLGGGGFTTAQQFVGTMEHVLAWDRMLSPAEVSQAWQALAAEMTGRGAVLNPPTSQTTSSVADCLGDSQTSGAVAGTSWCSTGPAGLMTLPAAAAGPSGWELNNNAEAGTTCVSMESGFPAEEALDWSPNAPHSALMLYCGINDLTVGGEPAAAIWQRELAICRLARQAGYENITATTLPSWIDQDGNVQQVNSLIRANWQSCFTGIVDPANDPRLGATGAYANGEYFDLAYPSHLNAAGQEILGGYATNVLASLYGATAASPTVVSASTQETAADNFVTVQGAAQPVTVTLPSCLGYGAGHQRSVTNAGSGQVSVAPAESSQLINNSASPVAVGAGQTANFYVQPLALETSGCAWTNSSRRYAAVVVTLPGQVKVGQAVTLTATASAWGAIPTGTVTFASGATPLGSAALTNGTASLTVSSNGVPPGTYAVTASYSGDGAYAATLSAPATVQVQQAPTLTTLTAAPNPVTPPDTATLTATVKRNYGATTGTPGGTVTFLYAGKPLATTQLNSSGVAVFTASTGNIPAGSYAITAQYNGDVYDVASTSAAVTVTVQ